MMKSMVFGSTILPLAFSSSPITDLTVIASDSDSCKYDVSKSGVDGNLNQDISHGVKLRLCMDRGGDKAITDLKLFKGDKEKDSQCGSGWHAIHHRGNANGDLNQGKHGKYETLCQRTDGSTPITDLKLQASKDCASGWKRVEGSNGDPNVNQHGHHDGKALYLCFKSGENECTADDVHGYWQYLRTLTGTQAAHVSKGCHKTTSASKTDSWSKSVTNAVSRGKFTAGGKNQKINTGTNSKSETLAHDYSESWTMDDTEDLTVTFNDDKNEGKALWQWQFHITDSCHYKVDALSPELATTPHRDIEPCCLPGLAYDAPTYQYCLDKESKLKLDKDDHCNVGKPPDDSRRRSSSRRRKSENEESLEDGQLSSTPQDEEHEDETQEEDDGRPATGDELIV